METVKIKKTKPQVATLTAEGLFTEQYWRNQGRSSYDLARKAGQSVQFTLDGAQVTKTEVVGGAYGKGENMPFGALKGLDATSLRNISKVASKLADLLEGIE